MQTKPIEIALIGLRTRCATSVVEGPIFNRLCGKPAWLFEAVALEPRHSYFLVPICVDCLAAMRQNRQVIELPEKATRIIWLGNFRYHS